MRRSTCWLGPCLAAALALGPSLKGGLAGEEPAAEALQAGIAGAKRALLKAQQADGSWTDGGAADDPHVIGTASIALLALLRSGMKADDPEIQRGLDWLRQQDPVSTKEISLMIQVLAAAADRERDIEKLTALARELEETQLREGPNEGSWTYSRRVRPVGPADRCNGYFAITGLRAAHAMGVPVHLETWRRARDHWLADQNRDGSWSYKHGYSADQATGSMTASGVVVLAIVQEMIEAAQEDDVKSDPRERATEKPIENACRWLGEHFTVEQNPRGGSHWILYYLDVLARAGRITDRQFFVDEHGRRHDWHAEGAAFLLSQQHASNGTWRGIGREAEPIVSTSFALLFLTNAPAEK